MEPNVEPQDCLQGTMHHRADSGLESKPDESTNYLRPCSRDIILLQIQIFWKF